MISCMRRIARTQCRYRFIQQILHNNTYIISIHKHRKSTYKPYVLHPQLTLTCIHNFTSTSTPSITPLFIQTTAKVHQIFKKFKPSLFQPKPPSSDPQAPSLTTIPLQKLGFDSLDVMEIIIAIEEQMSIELTDQQVLKLNTIDQIVEIFFMKANAQVMNKMVEMKMQQTRVGVKQSRN